MSKLSIIIPAYNEKAAVREIIGKIKAVNLGAVAKEIIVVDDGSNDGTREILKSIPGIRCIFHEKNLGKGAAVKTGFKVATGDILIIQDADLEYDPEDYPAVIAPILRGETEAVNGVRVNPKNDPRVWTASYILHWLGNAAITLATNLLYWNNAKEYEGCYKAFAKKLADSIPVKSNSFNGSRPSLNN